MIEVPVSKEAGMELSSLPETMKQFVDNAPTEIQPLHGFSHSLAGKFVLLG
jgi:hypothetical protein